MIVRDVAPSDAQAIARLHVRTWRATYRGIVPDAVLDGMSEDESATRFHGNILSWLETPDRLPFVVAVCENRVIGFSVAITPEAPAGRFDCEIKAIYVDPDEQRKGAGVAMIRESTRQFIALKREAMIVWAASESPWRCFYEKIGGVIVARSDNHIVLGGKAIPHIAYGWTDLHALAGATGVR